MTEQTDWQLYSDAATSLTKLYQHGAQQRRDAYISGYKAALEAVLQFAVKHCSDESSNTIDAASLINFVLPQLQQAANGQHSDRPDSKQPTPPPGADGVGQDATSMHTGPERPLTAGGFGAPNHSARAPESSPWEVTSSAPQLFQAAVSGSADAPLAPRKRCVAELGDDTALVEGGHELHNPLDGWPSAWAKRGRH